MEKEKRKNKTNSLNKNKTKKTFKPLKNDEVWFLTQENDGTIFETEDLGKTIGTVMNGSNILLNKNGSQKLEQNKEISEELEKIEKDINKINSYTQEINSIRNEFQENNQIINKEVKNLFEDILNNKFQTEVVKNNYDNFKPNNKIFSLKDEKKLNLKINILKKELDRLNEIKTQKEMQKSLTITFEDNSLDLSDNFESTNSLQLNDIKSKPKIDIVEKTAVMVQATQDLTNEKKKQKKENKSTTTINFLEKELDTNLKKINSNEKDFQTKDNYRALNNIDKYALDYQSFTIENNTNDFDKTVRGVKAEKANTKKWGYDNTTVMVDRLLDGVNKINKKDNKKPLTDNFDYDDFFDWIKSTKETNKKDKKKK